MAKIVVAQDERVLQEVALTQARTTLGRHPRSDIVLPERTVSGAHAVIVMEDGAAVLQDVGSSNGTRVNGARISRHALHDLDRIAIAPYVLTFRATPPLPPPVLALEAEAALPTASIEVTSGSNAGKTLALRKPLTTLGSPGVAVMVISRSAAGFAAAFIDGTVAPTVNGMALDKTPRPLGHGDQIDLAGTRMQFRLGGP